MKKSNNVFWYIIIILVTLLIGSFIYFSNKTTKLENELWKNAEKIVDTTRTDPKIIYIDSARVSKQDGVLVPKIIYKDTGSVKRVPIVFYDTIKEPFDTIAFLQDYFSMKIYMDSITSEDVEVKVFDTLQKNTILGREYQISNLRTEESFKRRTLYIGGTLGGSSESFSIGPKLSYIDKRGNLFSGHYLISPKDNQSILFSYGRKISLKRK